MRISDWSSDVCSSDLSCAAAANGAAASNRGRRCLSSMGDPHVGAGAETDTGRNGRPAGAQGSAGDAWARRAAMCLGGGFQPRSFWMGARSEEHTSELQSLMRISYAVFCLKKKNNSTTTERKIRSKDLK